VQAALISAEQSLAEAMAEDLLRALPAVLEHAPPGGCPQLADPAWLAHLQHKLRSYYEEVGGCWILWLLCQA